MAELFQSTNSPWSTGKGDVYKRQAIIQLKGQRKSKSKRKSNK